MFTTFHVLYVCPFVALSKAKFAENVCIVLSSLHQIAFILTSCIFINFFLFSWQGSNLRLSNLESDALPIESSRHPYFCSWQNDGSSLPHIPVSLSVVLCLNTLTKWGRNCSVCGKRHWQLKLRFSSFLTLKNMSKHHRYCKYDLKKSKLWSA